MLSLSSTTRMSVSALRGMFTYDADGNLTQDGRWQYRWDAENRLIRVQTRTDTPQGSWRRVDWTYDAVGRRIRQTTWTWNANSGAWVVTEDLKFVSDPTLFGRHIAELNAADNALVRTYVWGLDLSGTEQGAGGVGGLLWLTQHAGPNTGTHFAAYDGNGNIVALSAASDGSETARYEYGPFGEPLRITGPAAATLNPFRFSTKRTDPTTDLVLYEYRAYSPCLGRWMSRDPIMERGGRNIYGFLQNDPHGRHDSLGLESSCVPIGSGYCGVTRWYCMFRGKMDISLPGGTYTSPQGYTVKYPGREDSATVTVTAVVDCECGALTRGLGATVKVDGSVEVVPILPGFSLWFHDRFETMISPGEKNRSGGCESVEDKVIAKWFTEFYVVFALPWPRFPFSWPVRIHSRFEVEKEFKVFFRCCGCKLTANMSE